MNFSPADMQSMTEPYGSQMPPEKELLQLTPEEIKILKECSSEGIRQRAIPLAIVSSIAGLAVAKSGPLHHRKYGAKPAAIGFGILGYFIGRFSYTRVCLQRVMQVPDGTIKKMFPPNPNFPREVDPNSQYYADVETPKSQDSIWDSASASTDIDVASTGSFDTVPSDYYQAHPDDSNEQMPAQSFTSYDDLRKQNRDDFTNKYRVPSQQPPQQRYPQQRRPEIQDPPSSNFGKQQTKYGDSWE